MRYFVIALFLATLTGCDCTGATKQQRSVCVTREVRSVPCSKCSVPQP